LDLAEIVAVQAEGNFVSLRHRPNPYLLRESLSSMAEKLKPYGFIRIHRSVIVNISAVEEIQPLPLPTGQYRLRVKGGKEYRNCRYSFGGIGVVLVAKAPQGRLQFRQRKTPIYTKESTR
jgi:hypothetical protein